MRRTVVGIGLIVLGLVSCGDDDATADLTAASLAIVRGEVRVGDDVAPPNGRVAERARIRVGRDGRARVRFDEGASVLLDANSRLVVTSGDEGSFESGRGFFDVPAGEPFTLRTPKGEIRFADGQVAVEVAENDVKVRVIRGDIAYRLGRTRGVVDSGQRLVLRANGATVEPEALWDDFTGGLAAPGPRDPREAAGVGVLEGRRPGDVGEARWPLIVRTLDVHVRIVGDLAITDVEQIFFNPASTTLEGLYRIRVPEGAVLHRFAVDRNGQMVDGYVREKRDAAAAYQAQVYEGSTLDPALLEWDSPSSYRARIHPIVAGESRRIAIRYSEWLPRRDGEARAYRFPMGGGNEAPSIEALSIDVDLSGTELDSVRTSHGARLSGKNLRLRRSDFRPRSDFVVELVGDAEGALAYRSEHTNPLRDPNASRRDEPESDYFFVPLIVEPPNAGAGREGPIDLVIVADLSAGTDRSRLELGRTVIEAISAQLRDGDRLAIVGGDLRLRPLAESSALGAASESRVRRLLDALARSPSGGASDLGAMLTEAAGLLDPARNGSVVYVGDGAPTVGELGAGPLIERLSRLPNPLRSYAVAIGDDANADLLASVTRGAGRVERVTTRAEAADAALAIVSSAVRPVVSRIAIDLGTGIDRVFPRDAVSTTLGEPIPIVGRVRGSVPASVKVTGVFRGRRFERTVPVEVRTIEDSGDLRLRWATARLERLLLDGARRTEIVDLGVRSGVITPFTSLYVPSAAEVASLDPASRASLVRTALLDETPRVRANGAPGALAWLLAPIGSLYGCSDRSAPKVDEPGVAPVMPSSTAPPIARAPADDEGAMARQRAAESRSATAQAPAPSPAPDFARNAAQPGAAPTNEPTANPVAPLGITGTGEGGGGRRAEQTGQTSMNQATADGTARAPMRAHRGTVADNPYGGETRNRPEETETNRPLAGLGNDRTRREDGDIRAAAAALVALDAIGPTATTVTTTVRITTRIDHDRRICSDAAGMILEARANLWTERLAATDSPADWARIYERAVASCEAPSVRDRRKLLDLVLGRAGTVDMMISAYQSFVAQGARMYLRRAIFRRIRTPDELRSVRAAFGTETVDASLVEGELTRAIDDVAKVRVLRRLLARFDGDLELSMRLLSTYERLSRRDDAKQLALSMRANPLTDAGLRTAIGEMFLRFGDEPEARRTFSEIVEFAPSDELARRRLGDLYRAHGWYEHAYRQYTTLAELRPDDQTALLLLAQAAAGAGRIDEALRLEQRLAETAPRGGAEGPARTAILWSSVRLAELRADARAKGDGERLRAYLGAMRRGGVSREAGDLRATLVWAHPDADLSLYAAHPGLSLARPTDVSPELGLEAFDVREREPGIYRLEVRRGNRDRLTAVDAKLVVVLREGRADERIVVLPLRFAAGASRQDFVIDGDSVTSVGANGGTP